MTRRNGETCAVCGYPVPGPGEVLCEQCVEWQDVARDADAAIAAREMPVAGREACA